MLSLSIDSKYSPSDWENLLSQDGSEYNFFQSTHIASAASILDSTEPFFIKVLDERNKPVACMLLEKRFFFDRTKKRKRFILPIYSCFGGPVIIDHNRAIESMRLILAKTGWMAFRSCAMYIDFQGFSPLSRYVKDPQMVSVFRKSGFRVDSWATFLIDLTQSEENLWKNITHAARKCVNKCHRLNLEVHRVVSYDQFIEFFWKPYVTTEKYFGRETYPYSRDYWDQLKDFNHFYVAYDKKQTTMAVLGMLIFNGVAREIASAIIPEAYKQKIPAQDLLHWELLLEAKRLKCHTFDLAGVSPNPVSPKEKGIRRFKEKWGGQYIEYYTYKKNIIPFSDKFIKLSTMLSRNIRFH